jgi:hypothetical protein
MSSTSSSQFKGTIGRTWDESKPWWPQPTRAPADAPPYWFSIFEQPNKVTIFLCICVLLEYLQPESRY